jgi:AraC-like DNA-binding protein
VLGTSFRQLKEEVLKEFSTSLLLNDKIAIESLAEHLGYSEPSAFHRAFKSWFGVTPRQFCRLRHYQ